MIPAPFALPAYSQRMDAPALYGYAAKLVRVIDGDTVVLDLDLGFYQWRHGQSYRLLHINAPEMHVGGLPNPAGGTARIALRDLIEPAKTLIVQTVKSDNFGRFLIDLWADGVHVNEWMVAGGFAVPYVL